MRLRYTRHQVPRGTFPDAQTHNRIYLIKNVSYLHATYQVRLLFTWPKEGRKFVLRIPASCRLGRDLVDLRREYPDNILIERA